MNGEASSVVCRNKPELIQAPDSKMHSMILFHCSVPIRSLSSVCPQSWTGLKSTEEKNASPPGIFLSWLKFLFSPASSSLLVGTHVFSCAVPNRQILVSVLERRKWETFQSSCAGTNKGRLSHFVPELRWRICSPVF